MSDDIVTTLRRESFYRPTSRLNSFGMPQMGFELTSFGLIAADEIERLRNELAARCGDARPGAHTAGPVETFIPEAL